ncbi:hypothetical protein B4U79_00567 [Dinothrombium tinctorium]|uniref:Uncharacterized protein n=1 Tax=Dinothrombium tinctorium TaxID=1965070 RepID=A0A3S3RW34_9ACAR|nr:hypothetical protein B4U79_00567 [Dinothrombium tinctorium]
MDSSTACCKCCLLRIPFGTITATLLAVCGLVIAVAALLQSTVISDRIYYELLQRKNFWFNDLKVLYIISAIVLSVIILVNLMVGFATTGRQASRTPSNDCCRCCCNPGSASACVIKTIFVINYILYHVLFICTLILVVSAFICYTLSRLCKYESKLPDSEQNINLKQFAPFLSVRHNETELLYFTGNRLKMLCTDFMSTLTIYIILTVGGFILLCWGFMNFLINLSVNWARINTKQKCAELMYINSAEMTAFGDGTLDNGNRY